MAVSPLRALATAHVQDGVNRARRQAGVAGAWALWAMLGLVMSSTVLPSALVVGVLAARWAASVSQPSTEKLLPFITLLVTGFVVGGGLLGGLSGSGRQLPWELLRVYPLRRRTLFAAELFVGAVEPITAWELTTLGAACVGACVGAPRLAVVLVPLTLAHALLLLTLRLLVDAVLRRLSRRLRSLIALLPLVPVVALGAVPFAVRGTPKRDMHAFLTQLSEALEWIPTHRAMKLAVALVRGEPLPSGGGLAVLFVVGVALAIAAVTAALLAQETRSGPAERAGTKARPWTFSSPTWGVARLQWTSILSSLLGRLPLLLSPLLVIVVGATQGRVEPRWTVPLAFAYGPLACLSLLFNQFGLDRHGVKALLLLPISAAELLRGKQLAAWAWLATQAATLSVLLLLTRSAGPRDVLVGLLVYACVSLTGDMTGQLFSLWSPQPILPSAAYGRSMPLVGWLLVLAVGMLAVEWLGLAYLLGHFLPAWQIPLLSVYVLGLLALSQVVLPLNARFLVRRRERLIESLDVSA